MVPLGTKLIAWWCHADYSSSIITHRASNGRLQIIAVRSLKGALITNSPRPCMISWCVSSSH
uniref:Uncharacterized protein n=1 Tax=Setaria italica TaxID=4555 RepID=K4AHT4_SETIT